MNNPAHSWMEEILSSYFSCEGNAAEAARCLSISKETVKRYWKEQGFQLKSGGKRARLDDNKSPGELTEAEISAIVKAHGKYDSNATLAARYLPHCRETFLKYWKREGLPIRKRSNEEKPPKGALKSGRSDFYMRRSEMLLEHGRPEYGELPLSDAKLDRIIESFRQHDPDGSKARDVIRQMKEYM